MKIAKLGRVILFLDKIFAVGDILPYGDKKYSICVYNTASDKIYVVFDSKEEAQDSLDDFNKNIEKFIF